MKLEHHPNNDASLGAIADHIFSKVAAQGWLKDEDPSNPRRVERQIYLVNEILDSARSDAEYASVQNTLEEKHEWLKSVDANLVQALYELLSVMSWRSINIDEALEQEVTLNQS